MKTKKQKQEIVRHVGKVMQTKQLDRVIACVYKTYAKQSFIDEATCTSIWHYIVVKRK